MPQGDKDKMIKFFWAKMAIKVTKGQTFNGTISKNTCHEESRHTVVCRAAKKAGDLP